MFTPLATRRYLGLLLFTALIMIPVILAGRLIPGLYNTTHAVMLTAGFMLAAFISLLIFFNGYFSEPEKNVFMTLMALGVKMLLSFVLALLFLLVFKNDSTGSVVLFFILYLAFTIYIVRTFKVVLKQGQIK